ncbi:wapl-1 [Pristionchus pacificus]|uniref:Wapl-1 n=1 Tax=Pristionchus pacificus TaxID=54126 RepID=A0A2A6CAQ3_PRIPA|nr:wapl-1 [Pristionchus pacificus]|eukprot:PDM75209.1 wapl-1 [Pristionchus pacificus]
MFQEESRSMASDPTNGKNYRSYGAFHSGQKAASLFDAAFSKPVVKRTSKVNLTPAESSGLPNVNEAVIKHPSPRQVFSPPVSLPESTSDNGLEDNMDDDEDDAPQPSTQGSLSSQGSLTRNMSHATISRDSPKKRDANDAYDFNDSDESPPVPPKKSRIQEDEERVELEKKKKPVYRHKWNAGDEEEEEEEEEDRNGRRNSASAITQPSVVSRRGVPIYARESQQGRVRNVKEPHQMLESGEHDDFKDDLKYMLTSLKGDGSTNIKCLSATSLARKCINPQFRHLIRSEKEVTSLFHSLVDSPSDESFALASSSVIYLICRDSVSIAVDTTSARILAQLLKLERPANMSESVEKQYKTIWSIFSSYLEKMESSGRKISFDLTEDELSPSSLILEALVFVLTNSRDADLKNDLLSLGILQWIVARVDRIVEDLSSVSVVKAERLLIPLERCFRVLEICSMYHKKNQAFLIAHRSSVIIEAANKLMVVVHSRVSSSSSPLSLRKSLMRSLTLLARVLTNLSYDNELCSTKLGQMSGFLSSCISTFTFLGPKYISDDAQGFDLTLLMSSLVVNLVEKCNGNRKKIVDASIMVYRKGEEGKEEEGEEPALTCLTKLFVLHEEAAREADCGIDKELVIEEPDENPSDEDGEGGSDEELNGVKNGGRLDRGKMGEMNEGDMIDALKGVLSKASSHMEDSMIASHLALLIGCVLQQNEDHVRLVRSLLPDDNLALMVEQLQRYLEFLRLAGVSASQSRSMERIIEFLERLDA